MVADLHNHTVRCNHCSGTVHEFLHRAVLRGIDIYGFADHAPMHWEPEYRMGFDDMRGYEEEIKNAAESFKDKIDVRLGYEVDYLPGYMDDRVLNAKVDYLIGSVHFIDKWGFDNPVFVGYYKDRDINEIWIEYFMLIREMAQTKLFDIVGHIDLVKVFNFLPTRELMTEIKEALVAIKEAGMAVEMNSSGLRKPVQEIYPSLPILQAMKEVGVPITFSSDAHAVEHVGAHIEQLRTIASSVGYDKIAVFKDRQMELVRF